MTYAAPILSSPIALLAAEQDAARTLYALTRTQRTQLESWHAQMITAINAGAFNTPRLRTLRSRIAFQLRMDSHVAGAEFLADWTPGIVAEIASVARFAAMGAHRGHSALARQHTIAKAAAQHERMVQDEGNFA